MNIIKIKTANISTDELYSVHCVHMPSIFTYIFCILLYTFHFRFRLKEMWPLNECVFYVQIQAVKTGLF